MGDITHPSLVSSIGSSLIVTRLGPYRRFIIPPRANLLKITDYQPSEKQTKQNKNQPNNNNKTNTNHPTTTNKTKPIPTIKQQQQQNQPQTTNETKIAQPVSYVPMFTGSKVQKLYPSSPSFSVSERISAPVCICLPPSSPLSA